MNYFKYFPLTAYGFGNETQPDVFRNITVYAEVIDEIRNNLAFYNDYHIQEFERPDQVSQKLYGTPNYHWTLWLMNDNIREQGWPLSNREINERILETYPHKVITTKTTLTDRFIVGQTLTGNSSGATGTIHHRHLDLGQLVVNNATGTFRAGEIISSTNADGDVETITVTSFEDEYNSAHHYEDANGNYVDIDPTVGPGAQLTEVTYFDRYFQMNEDLKQIRVIKPNNIIEVVNAFREAIRS